MNCSLWGLFQSITPAVNYKIGTALCKCRLCPNCQRVLAAKRRANFLDWFELNAAVLRRFFFYHMVLTLRHSSAEGVRTNLYTPDLLECFAQLRGTSLRLSGAQRRARSARWKEFVAGGSYSIEIKQGSDESPHIHMHCLVMGQKQLWNKAQDSVFLLYIKPLWKQITEDSDNVFVEPVHFIDPDTKQKHFCHLGSNVHIGAAVAECAKYTIKANAEDLAGYSDDFLTDLLTFRNRYYSRFGCLSSNDKTSKQFQHMEMLCTDYKDLEQLSRQELARLFNPETGELVKKEDTQLLATPFRNMKGKIGAVRVHDAEGNCISRERGEPMLGGENYFQMKPAPAYQTRWFPEHERDKAAMLLARSIGSEYNEDLEISTK